MHGMQPWTEPLPTSSEYVPRGHGVHVEADVAPSASEYVPAGHFMQL